MLLLTLKTTPITHGKDDFRDCVRHLEVEDVNFRGIYFTWSKILMVRMVSSKRSIVSLGTLTCCLIFRLLRLSFTHIDLLIIALGSHPPDSLA